MCDQAPEGQSPDMELLELSPENVDPIFAYEVLSIEMGDSEDEIKVKACWPRTKSRKNNRKCIKKNESTSKLENRLNDIDMTSNYIFSNKILSDSDPGCDCRVSESLPTECHCLQRCLPLKTKRKRILKGYKSKVFTCDVCFVRFACCREVYEHKRIHNSEVGFCCNRCAASFTRINDLNVHKRTHKDEKPYTCEECSAKFPRMQDLDVHMRKHTGERPFSCQECSYVCSRAHTLKKHMQIHTGEKPFACEICSHRFGQLSDLNIHKRKHTGEKPYSCDECNSRYSQLGSLKRHRKSHAVKGDQQT